MMPRAAQAKTPKHDFSQNEFPLGARDFAILAELVKADAGIVLEPEKMSLVYARLARRLRLLGLESFRKYCAFVKSNEGASERRQMIEALTTNVTRFFREAHHFMHLKTEVLPGLIARARAGERVRLWSAGCSSGEEPYSIALTLLSLMPDAGKFDIKVLGTDIDRGVLQQGREGIYPQSAIAPIGAELRERWFAPCEAAEKERLWQVKPELRGLVAFRMANLIGPWPMKGPFRVVVCRNTVIYFGEAARAQIWIKMAALIAPGGYLYIGHSERLPAGLSCFQPAGLTVFLRDESAAPETIKPYAKEKH